MSFASYDALIAAFTAGKGQDYVFNKTTLSLAAASAGHSLWNAAGAPGQGSFGGSSAGVWTAQNSSTAGAIAFANPTGPDTLHLVLAGCVPNAASAGTMLIYDRLGQVEFLPLNDGSLPEVTAVSSDFTARLAAGEGAQIFAEITHTVMATGAVFQISSYTNQAGTAARASEVVTCNAVASQAAGRFPYTNRFFINLQAGDTGVRSIESVTLTANSSTTAAKMNIVAARPLTYLPMNSANVYVERDLVLATIKMPRIRDNACIALAVLSAGTSLPVFNGNLIAIAG